MMGGMLLKLNCVWFVHLLALNLMLRNLTVNRGGAKARELIKVSTCEKPEARAQPRLLLERSF